MFCLLCTTWWFHSVPGVTGVLLVLILLLMLISSSYCVRYAELNNNFCNYQRWFLCSKRRGMQVFWKFKMQTNKLFNYLWVKLLGIQWSESFMKVSDLTVANISRSNQVKVKMFLSVRQNTVLPTRPDKNKMIWFWRSDDFSMHF